MQQNNKKRSRGKGTKTRESVFQGDDTHLIWINCPDQREALQRGFTVHNRKSHNGNAPNALEDWSM